MRLIVFFLTITTAAVVASAQSIDDELDDIRTQITDLRTDFAEMRKEMVLIRLEMKNVGKEVLKTVIAPELTRWRKEKENLKRELKNLDSMSLELTSISSTINLLDERTKNYGSLAREFDTLNNAVIELTKGSLRAFTSMRSAIEQLQMDVLDIRGHGKNPNTQISLLDALSDLPVNRQPSKSGTWTTAHSDLAQEWYKETLLGKVVQVSGALNQARGDTSGAVIHFQVLEIKLGRTVVFPIVSAKLSGPDALVIARVTPGTQATVKGVVKEVSMDENRHILVGLDEAAVVLK